MHWLKLSVCPPLNFPHAIVQGGPPLIFTPGSCKGLEKTVLKNLRAPSPFGPNFGTGFFRTPTKAKGPQERPCLCLYLPGNPKAKSTPKPSYLPGHSWTPQGKVWLRSNLGLNLRRSMSHHPTLPPHPAHHEREFLRHLQSPFIPGQ